MGRSGRGKTWDGQVGVRRGTVRSGSDMGQSGRGKTWDSHVGVSRGMIMSGFA